MAPLKPIVRRPKAADDIESHATFIAEGSIDAALRFLERAEQTIKGLALFPASGAPFPSNVEALAGMRTKLVKDFPNTSCSISSMTKQSKSCAYCAAVRT